MSTQNQFQVSNFRIDYVALAAEKGAACGKFVKSLKTLNDRDEETIHRAAIAFVNSLPLDDIGFETEIRAAFEDSARKAFVAA